MLPFLAEHRNPNGPGPLAGSVERSFGHEIERDPAGRGAAQISFVNSPHSSYSPMPTPALGEFDRVAVRVMNSHRPFPRLFMRWLKKFHPPTFQLLVKGIEMIGSQFNVDARSLLRCHAFRSERIAAIVDQQAYRPTRRPADADHRKLRSLVDFNRKTELVSVKIDRTPHVGYAECQSLQSNINGVAEFRAAFAVDCRHVKVLPVKHPLWSLPSVSF